MTMPIGTISYTACSLAFLVLSLLLLTTWRGRLPGGYLVLATMVTAVWAGAHAWQAGQAESHTLLTGVLGVLRYAAWFTFLIVLLAQSARTTPFSAGRLRLWATNLTAICLAVMAATIYSHIGNTPLHQAVNIWGGIMGRVLLALAGMVLVEQFYRNTYSQQRWSIKFLCLGLGGMFAYDFYLFADAMLFRHVNPDLWNARGVIDVLVVPLIAVSAARNPTWSLEIAVSRRILFHSTTLLGAGVYLLTMSAAGYYIRYFGGSWGGVLQVTFLFGALLLLLAVLFSGAVRARIRVFLSKHFFSYSYDYREEWLRFTNTLSEGEPGVRLRERAIQALAELVESPGGALWMREEQPVFERVAHWNMSAAVGSEPTDSAFCRFFMLYPWIISLEEHAKAPNYYPQLPQLPAWLTQLANGWLVVPLVQQDSLLGFVVLARAHAPISLNWETRDILKTAGRQAASYLAQIEAARALLLARQFESFSRMSAFVVHDLKNLATQLSLLLSNAERHRDNPEFQQDMLDTVTHSVVRMKRLLVQLHPGGGTAERLETVMLDSLLRQVVATHANHMPAPVAGTLAPGLGVSARSERLERILGHLVLNAIEASPEHARVTLCLTGQDGFAVIEVTDTGCGMSEQFIREKLYAPFESAKITGMGIGVYECREYVRELGGRIEVTSREQHGTTFLVFLPLATPHYGHTHVEAAPLETSWHNSSGF